MRMKSAYAWQLKKMHSHSKQQNFSQSFSKTNYLYEF